MTEITRHTGQNIGGFKSLQYVFTDDVAICDFSSLHEILITFNNGKGWLDFYFTPGSLKIKVKVKQTNAGEVYTHYITLRVPKSNKELADQLSKMYANGIMLRVEDGNGIVRIFGEKMSAIYPSHKLLLPGEVENYNGYELIINWEASDEAFYER